MTATRTLNTPAFNLIPRQIREADTASVGFLEKYWNAVDALLTTWEQDALDPVSDAWHTHRAPDAWLPYIAAKHGITLPPVRIPRLRQFLQNLPFYLRQKGNYAVVASAVFVATQVGCEIRSHWQESISEGWEIGRGEVELTEIGLDYKPEASDTFEVGLTEVGYGVIGKAAVNEGAPYEIHIHFALEPLAEVKEAIRWVVDLLRRAIDVPVYHYTPALSGWIIGSSRVGVDTTVAGGYYESGVSMHSGDMIVGDPFDVLRITLPDDTDVVDD